MRGGCKHHDIEILSRCITKRLYKGKYWSEVRKGTPRGTSGRCMKDEGMGMTKRTCPEGGVIRG